MKTVEQILTKKDYSNKSRFFTTLVTADTCKPLWIKALFVVIIACAAMGEWKTINAAYAGLPKAITLGAIGFAFFYGIITSDYNSFKKILKPMLMYVALILLIMLSTLVIWILGFTEISSITRGGSKMLFQMISVLTAVSCVYMFGKESIKLFFISICIVNGTIMLLEIPNYGLAESIKSVWHCVITFGDSYGYSMSLEIHDLTFLMGQFAVYYGAFAPSKTKQEKQERIICFLVAVFFFVVGMKRIAIPTVVAVILLGLVLKRLKKRGTIVNIIGFSLVILAFVFLYSVRNGSFADLLGRLGVDMMGREALWQLASDYYEFSPRFIGLGFEAVDALVGQWYEAGIITYPYPFHNDILKVFVELGFYGFIIWIVMQYAVYPVLWNKLCGADTALVYMGLFLYMSATYMTDNTAFYFWSVMGLRLIPLAYSWDSYKKQEEEEKWSPPSCKDMEHRIKELCDDF